MSGIQKLKDSLLKTSIIFLITTSLYLSMVDARISNAGILYDFTPERFEGALKSGKPTLLDFSKDTCGFCVKMIPTMKELREEYGNVVNIITVDADEYNELAEEFEIYGVPVFIFFDRNGNEVDRLVGYQEKETLVEYLEEFIPDITIKKSIRKEGLENGTFIVYLEIENNGRKKIENMEIKDKIPEGLDVLVSESSPKLNMIGDEIIFHLDLHPRNWMELSYKLKTYSPGTIFLDATTVSYELDGETIEVKSNEVATTIESIKLEVENKSYEKIEKDFKSAIIVISKFLSKDTVKEGEEVMVTLEIKNIGDGDARDLRIIDSVCEGIRVASGVTTKNFPMLRVDQKETLNYVISSNKAKNYAIPPANIIFSDDDGVHMQESNEVDLTVEESKSYSNILKGIGVLLLFLLAIVFVKASRQRR